MYCPQNEWSLPNWFGAVEPTETLQIGPPQWNIGRVHKMGDTDTTIEFGLRENLQETIDFPIKYGAFRLSCKFPPNPIHWISVWVININNQIFVAFPNILDNTYTRWCRLVTSWFTSLVSPV